MYKITLAALALSVLAPLNAHAAGGGLQLNNVADKLTDKLPVLGNLVSPKGVTLPVLGKLPGLNFPLGQIPVLAGVNVSDLLNAVNVGSMGQDTTGIVIRQVQNLSLRR